MDIKCKNYEDIHYLLFGHPEDNVFTESKFQSYIDNEIIPKNKLIDMRQFKFEYYYKQGINKHHPTTASFRKIIIPYLSKILNFDYKEEDFLINKWIDNEYGMDFSFSVPKKENLFTLSISNEIVAEHGNYKILRNCYGDWKGNEIGDVVSPYHMLYRGAHKCSEIINETIDNDKSIIISGDSFWIPIMPIIAEYFKKVVLLDNRDYVSHKQYFENILFDKVVISLFEGINFNQYLNTNLL